MKTNTAVTVTIVGAGMVGLALANQLSQAGIAVEVVERRAPQLDFEPRSSDRVSALNRASRDLLQSLGVWAHLRPACVAPCTDMRVWTEQNNGAVHFSAREIGKKHLAYIVENQEVVRVLWQKAASDPLISITLCEHYELDSSRALIVGADGAHSTVREQAGITLTERAYGQQAIVATVTSVKPHRLCAYQNFLKTGPLGVLPLHDAHSESIVWSANDEQAQYLMHLNDAQFNIALSNALDLRLGKLTLKSARHIFPLVMRHAWCYVKPGIALVGDAAHTVHPLAGQGVNLGFQDVLVLSANVIKAYQRGRDVGALDVLRDYERERKWRNQQMLLLMQVFRSSGSSLGFGFGLIDHFFWLKKKIVEHALSQPR